MASVRPGHVLADKYRVERVLGTGGMGYVVAARHLQLDQMVAIKLLRNDTPQEAAAVERFLREAKAVVRLRGEHVARVLDVGALASSGEPYIVMEYLEGSDLSALAKKRGPLPVAEATDWVLQACEALAEAHALGIVHRDVKLANLFLTRGPGGAPLVKVLDFGISKQVTPLDEIDVEVTQASTMLGSPKFMSPEQMRDPRAVDARTDIWSLGVVLYRLVTGVAPFDADVLGRIFAMVMEERPEPLRARRPDVPPGFEAVVMHCLEKDPLSRPSHVAELAAALAPYASDPAAARHVVERVATYLRVRPNLSMTAASLPSSSTPPMAVPVAAASAPASAATPLGRPRQPRRPSRDASATTGSHAPWTGSASPVREGQALPRASLIGAAVAIAAVALAVTLVLGHRRDAASGVAASREPLTAPAPRADVSAASTALPAATPSSAAWRAPPFPTGAPPTTRTAPPAPSVVVVGTSPRTAEPPRTREAATPAAPRKTRHRPSRQPPSREPVAETPMDPPAAAAPPVAEKADDGIPSTRD